MKNIYKVKYVDAFYFYNQECPKIKVKVHEAYGYLTRKKNNIFLEFIKSTRTRNNKIIKGLIIPNSALISEYMNKKNGFVFRKGSKVSIHWQDVVYVANTIRQKSSIMYSVGVVFRTADKYVVLKSPETKRIYPKPRIQHPQEQPTYYVIPKSLIIENHD